MSAELAEVKAEIIRLRDRVHTLSNETQHTLAAQYVEICNKLDTLINGTGNEPGMKERIGTVEREQDAMRRRELTREDRDFKTRLVAIGSFLAWVGTMLAFFIQYLWKKATA